MNRLDNRDLETFKKDIKFGTQIEKYWIDQLVSKFKGNQDISKIEIKDNGVDNSGEYVEQSNGNADYEIAFSLYNFRFNGKLEVKFAPTKGKVTFKQKDLQNYIKQKAYVYLIYNEGDVSMRKPSDYDFEKHIKLIEENKQNVVWTILDPTSIDKFVQCNDPKKIPYMGFKMGYILTPEEIKDWFTVKWSNYEL